MFAAGCSHISCLIKDTVRCDRLIYNENLVSQSSYAFEISSRTNLFSEEIICKLIILVINTTDWILLPETVGPVGSLQLILKMLSLAELPWFLNEHVFYTKPFDNKL